jgi:hypothetical protein
MASIDIKNITALTDAIANTQETDKAKKVETINAKIADLIWADYTYKIDKPGSTTGEKENKTFSDSTSDDEIDTIIVPELMTGITDTDGTLKTALTDALKVTKNALIELKKVDTQATQEAINTSSQATNALKDAIGEDAITTIEAYKDKPRPKMTDIDPNFWWYINAIQIIITELGASSLLWDSKNYNKSADILWPRTKAGVKTIQNYLNTTYPETKLVPDWVPGPLTISALLAPVSADDTRSRLEKMLADKKDKKLTLTPEEPILTTSTDTASQDKAKVTKKGKKWENDPNGDGVEPPQWWTGKEIKDTYGNIVYDITSLDDLPQDGWKVEEKKVYRFHIKDTYYFLYGNKRASIQVYDPTKKTMTWKENKNRDEVLPLLEHEALKKKFQEVKKRLTVDNKDNKSYQELWTIIKDRFVHDKNGKEYFNDIATLKTNEYILTWLLNCKEAKADPTTKGGLQYILNQIWSAYTQRSNTKDIITLYKRLDKMKKVTETIDTQTKKEMEEAYNNSDTTKFNWITSLSPENTTRVPVLWTLWASEGWLKKSNEGNYLIEVDYSENVGEIVKDIKKGREEYKKVSKTTKKDEYK